MKLSVSVPDELWASAVEHLDDPSPSVVVQQALTALTAHRQGHSASYAVRPELDPKITAALDVARNRLVDEARALYQEGYRNGISLAKDLGYSQIDYLVRTGLRKAAGSMSRLAYEIEIGQSDLPDDATPLVDPALLIPTLGSLADFTGEVEWTPQKPSIEGMTRALQDVWAALRDDAPTPVA